LPRYAPSGKRLVSRPVRPRPPRELLAAIDGLAAKVLKFRADRDDLEARVQRLDHAAYGARFEAGRAADPGLRKILNDQADRLAVQAGNARSRLSDAERALGGYELALGRLHQEARAWQAGQRETGLESSSHARDMS
jgi:hypothetical protein